MELVKNIIKNILGLSIEQVTLISIIVTFTIYLFNKRNELRFKKHELKKDKYVEFISIFEDSIINNGHLELNDNLKKRFFELGSTIFIYGSKKMYKKYCFFRDASGDVIKKTIFYDQDIILFLLADLLNQIRKEVGLNEFQFPLNFKSVAFFINNMYYDPLSNFKWWKYKLKVILIKFELFTYRMVKLELLRIIFLTICFPFQLLFIIFRSLIMIPIGKILLIFKKN